MPEDERGQFRKWSAAVGISDRACMKLLEHLPDDSVLDPELPCWIGSPSRVMSANDPAHGFGLEKEPLEQGFLVIGDCPNGDPVVVDIREADLPVFYLSHEQLYDNPLPQVMRKVSESIAAFNQALFDEDSKIPLDYWDARDADRK